MERRRASTHPLSPRPVEQLEGRTLFAIPAIGQWALYADDGLTVTGLTGSYVNQSLRAETGHADWRAAPPISGTRLDRTINFTGTSWGDRAAAGVTGGPGDDWDDFSAQWDGYVRVTSGHVNLRMRSDGGSRLYIDADRDGQFEPDQAAEYLDNGWGTDPRRRGDRADVGRAGTGCIPRAPPVRGGRRR